MLAVFDILLFSLKCINMLAALKTPLGKENLFFSQLLTMIRSGDFSNSYVYLYVNNTW